MHGPIRTCTSHELLLFLKKGDHKSYLMELAQYDSAESDWFRFQILALRVLTYDKSVNQAFELARNLSQSLTKSTERQLAQAEFLFISWLQFSRRHTDLQKLEALLVTEEYQEHKCYWDHLRLRTQAMKIMLGLACANEKSALLERYQGHVDALLRMDLDEEAFFCLNEQIDLTAAKPFPNITAALKCINQYLYRLTLKNQPYHAGVLLARKAMLAAEIQIRKGESPDVSNILRQAEQHFGLAGNKEALNAFRSDYGALLLRYGLNKGKKVLVKAIREYQESGNRALVQAPIQSLISWQKVTGSRTELGSFQYLMSRAIASRPTIKNVLGMSSPEEQDESLKLQYGLFKAQNALLMNQSNKAKELISYLEVDSQRFGLTYLSLKVKALSLIINQHLSTNEANGQVLETAIRFDHLGYPQEGLDLLTQALFIELERGNNECSIHDLESFLTFVNSLNESSKPDTYLAEAKGHFYEVVSLLYLKRGNPKKAYELIVWASKLYDDNFLRPKSAFNQLYQAQVLRLFYCQSKCDSHKKNGLMVLQEAASLFRLMGFKKGEARAHLNKTHFQERYFDPLPSIPISTGFLNAKKSKLNIANAQTGEGTLYEVFDSVVGSLIKGSTFFHSHSLNQN